MNWITISMMGVPGVFIGVVAAALVWEAYRAGRQRGYDEGWEDGVQFCAQSNEIATKVPYPESKEEAEEILASLDS